MSKNNCNRPMATRVRPANAGRDTLTDNRQHAQEYVRAYVLSSAEPEKLLTADEGEAVSHVAILYSMLARGL